MKNKIVYIMMVLLIAGCQPDAHKEIGPARDLVQSMNGTWKLTRVIQRDNEAVRKGFPFRDLDITGLFPYSDFILTLNADAGNPTTYSSVQGNAPAILKSASGNWTVDNPDYPGVIALANGTTVDSIRLGGYPVGAETNLSLTVQRKLGEKLVISYIYEFTKQ
ncbi:MAG: DUF5004 domain-containing protein [Chitinophagaceae bacterium]